MIQNQSTVKMHRQEPRYKSQQHQPHYPRQPHYVGGVQQGPPPNVGQARMPNAAASMRAQGMNVRPVHGSQQQPQQQQQQPQQIQNQQVQQQTHAGVVQHHQGYPQVSAQGHHAQHTHAMYYQHNPQVPQSFIQISPYPVSVTPNPGMPLHHLTQARAYIPQYTAYSFPTANNQQQAFFTPQAASAHTQQMYTAAVPQYVPQHHRMPTAPMHAPGQAVASAQHLQQAPVAQTHAGVVTGISAAQHQSQHSHSQQSGVPVVAPQAQQIPRQEQQAQGRKKKLLELVDPKTMQKVVLDSGVQPSTPETTPQGSESAAGKGASSNDTAQGSISNSTDKPDGQSQSSVPPAENHDSKQKEDITSAVKDDVANGTVNDTKKAVRAEFFQKIAQASDESKYCILFLSIFDT